MWQGCTAKTHMRWELLPGQYLKNTTYHSSFQTEQLMPCASFSLCQEYFFPEDQHVLCLCSSQVFAFQSTSTLLICCLLNEPTFNYSLNFIHKHPSPTLLTECLPLPMTQPLSFNLINFSQTPLLLEAPKI